MNPMKKSRLAGLLVVFTLLFGLTGCGDEAPEVDENLLLQEAWYNLANSSSVRYEIVFDAEVLDQGAEYVVDLDASGAYSAINPEQEGTEMNVVLKADSPDGGYRFDFAMKEVGESLYVKLLDLPSVPNMPTEVFAEFTDTWWQLDGAQSSDLGMDLGGLSDFGLGYEDLGEKEKEVRDLILTSHFFKDIQFDGDATVKGKDAYSYKVVFDVEGVRSYLESAYEILGEEFTPEDKTTVDGFASSLAGFVGSVWIDVDSTTIVKMAGPFESETGMKGDFEITVFDINQPFAVKEPVDFEVFDLAMFFGAFIESTDF